MAAKTVQAPSLIDPILGAFDASWLRDGHVLEFVLVAMILSTVCYRVFSGLNR